MLTKPPLYGDLIERHGLSVIAEGGDLVLTPDGDIAITKSGGALFGSVAHNAMFRLTEAWRLNSPSLRLMYEAVRELRGQHTALEDEVEMAATVFGFSGPEPFSAEVSAFHTANDAFGAALLGRGALAGSLMVVTSSLLSRFKSDVEPTAAEWKDTGPFENGVSVGRLIIAAANGFRHHDEWIETRVAGAFTANQRRSIDPLVQALNLVGPDDLFDDVNACERVIVLLGDQGFEQFEGAVLKYANAVAALVEARSPPPL
ncbi:MULTISPECIES: hypothetical protein [unclassified Methylobacterium]|uniref:hypothetical protein n=1 Tax=unclassified Methylobacterium TaxID=2615210 RepID=UPI0011C202F2|nr:MULTISPECIES: hypothetical protein [unclassified Methylobacterium]QEE37604.1 hypothetical protein FVA80_00180 [Methylobacterium sp. WL1]TXN52333.1 hypothetical protein FV241_29640 [Methylobacterium sp. WL2]